MPHRTARLAAILCAVNLVAHVVAIRSAHGDSSGPFSVPRLTSSIAIDGVLDEPAWQQALSIDVPLEVSPGENTPAPVRTDTLLTHDDDNLYVAFRAFDPDPASIRAHLSDRDSFGGDDWVGIVLDTFNDQRRDFLLLVNPVGVQLDRIEVRGANAVEWDGIWESAARITDWGWVAELKIPFKSLSFQRVDGPQVWGFDAIRGYPRSISRQMGAFARDRNSNCYLCQAIKISGFEGISPSRNLELNPTVTAVATDTREDIPDGPMTETDREAEAGLTARWGITPNLTLGGTLNPDFSQVEADALQLDVNEPFALFYDEKRPFFMEASDFFKLPLDVVYTRTIRDPSWGVKLTGKEGAHTVASYVVQDSTTNLLFPGSQSSASTSLDMTSLDTVVRYKRDIGDRYTLGVLMTDRRGDDGYFNQVAGLDGDFRLTDTDRIRFLALRSSTRYPDDIAREFGQPTGTFDDWAGEAVYSHDSRNFDAYVHLRDMGTDFRADQGFIPMVDYRGGEIGVTYEWLPDGDTWFSGLALQGMVNTFDDGSGDLLLRQSQLTFIYEGPLQSHAQAQLTHSREGYGGQTFTWNEVYVHNCMHPTSAVNTWINVRLGDRIDYVNTRLGRRARIEPGVELRLGRHLKTSFEQTYERMTVEPGRLYTARISQLTAAYQFNPRCFLRAIAQHVRYDYEVELYQDGRDPRFERLFSQLLFSYKLNPRTVLFLGYTDNRLGSQDYDLTPSDRTLFAKVGYAWSL